MFNFFNKKSDKPEVKYVSNKIYKDKLDIIYKNGEKESFYGESECAPALWTQTDRNKLKICEYKLPCNLNKTYYRNISEIDYIQNYEMEIIKGE